MALDFGQSFFKQTADDGTFARKNVQINKADIQPILQNDGDMILWEQGEGAVYDGYNSVVDNTKWGFDNSVNSGAGSITINTGEMETYIYTSSDVTPATYGIGTFDQQKIYTKLMESRALYGTLEFNVYIKQFGPQRHEIQISALGILAVDTDFNTMSNVYKTYIIKLTKNIDSTYEVFVDDVLVASDQSATDDDIFVWIKQTSTANWTTGGGAGLSKIYIYEIKAGQQTTILIKGTTQTFKIPVSNISI